MKIKNYPYGFPTKTLRNASRWLNYNKKRIIKRVQQKQLFNFFDFPDYWDMPKKISSRLDSDEVDWIQEETYDWVYKYL